MSATGNLIIHNIGHLVTMNATREILHDAWLLARGGFIEATGTGTPPRIESVPTHDAHGGIATPGLINTHHHFYQTLTRAFPPALDRTLFPWLKALYPVWAQLTPASLDAAVTVALMRPESAVFGAPRSNVKTRQPGPIAFLTCQRCVILIGPPGATACRSTIVPR